MHSFKAFTFAIIVIWCQVEGSHSHSKNESIDIQYSSSRLPKLDEVEVTTVDLYFFAATNTTTTNNPENDSVPPGVKTASSETSEESVQKLNKSKTDEFRLYLNDSKVKQEAIKPYARSKSTHNVAESEPDDLMKIHNAKNRTRYKLINSSNDRPHSKDNKRRDRRLRKRNNGTNTKIKLHRKKYNGTNLKGKLHSKKNNGTNIRVKLHRKLKKGRETANTSHVLETQKPQTNHTKDKPLRDGSVLSDDENIKNSVNKPPHRWPKKKNKQYVKQIYGPNQAYDKGTHKERDEAYKKAAREGPYQKYTRGPGGEDTTKYKYSRTTKSVFGDELRPYTIKAHLTALKCKFRKANITVEAIGRTVSYNDIVMYKATSSEHKRSDGPYFRAEKNRFEDEGPEKRIVFIVHGLSVMGIHDLPCLSEVKSFERLLSYYFAHLDKFDIFLIPMANPDGVAVPSAKYRSYNVNNAIQWNKNTSPQSECSGVALDRNFDVASNATRRDVSSCNQQYPGPHAFSEVETRAIRDVLHRYSHRIVAYLHVHSGTYTAKIFKGDAVLYPRGYTEEQTDDDKYIDLRGEVEEALKNASFQVYTVAVDTLYNWYGKVAGTSVDYASSEYGIPFAMELVMQLYDNSAKADKEEQEQNAVLRTAWRRVIDVIFTSVQRYVNATGV